MILCKSYKRKFFESQVRITGRIRGVRRFALRPTKIITGEWVWFESYNRYYVGIEEVTEQNQKFYRLATRKDLPARMPRYINTLMNSAGPFLLNDDKLVKVNDWAIDSPDRFVD